MPLVCVWHTEQFYTTGPVPWNAAGGLADRNLGLSYHLARMDLPSYKRLYTNAVAIPRMSQKVYR